MGPSVATPLYICICYTTDTYHGIRNIYQKIYKLENVIVCLAASLQLAVGVH